MTTEESVSSAHCNNCGGNRKHDVVYKQKFEWSDEDLWGGSLYELLQCRGCESVTVRHKSWFSEDYDEHGPAVNTTYYPPATFRNKPRWMAELMLASPLDDQSVYELLEEIYSALWNNSLRLAAMGIRAVLEHVMIQKTGDHANFKANLDAFERGGFVSRIQRQVVEPAIDAGSAAMHRSFRPSKNDLISLMDVMENILESIYVNDESRAAAISQRVPPRGKRTSDDPEGGTPPSET